MNPQTPTTPPIPPPPGTALRAPNPPSTSASVFVPPATEGLPAPTSAAVRDPGSSLAPPSVIDQAQPTSAAATGPAGPGPDSEWAAPVDRSPMPSTSAQRPTTTRVPVPADFFPAGPAPVFDSPSDDRDDPERIGTGPSTSHRRPLIAALAALVLLVGGLGTFALTRRASEEAIPEPATGPEAMIPGDDADAVEVGVEPEDPDPGAGAVEVEIEIEPDDDKVGVGVEPDDDEVGAGVEPADTGSVVADVSGYSFEAAVSNAQHAASVRYEMTSQDGDGTLRATATMDRASGRMSMDYDLSGIDTDDDSIPYESASIIVDEQTQIAYISADVFGFLLPTEPAGDDPAHTDTDTDTDTGTDTGEPSWLSASIDGSDDDTSGSFGESFADPFALLDVLGASDATDLGRETIDGEELGRFAVQADPDDPILSEMLGGLRTDDLGEIGFDVWVTRDHQIRRIAVDVDVAGVAANTVMDLEISDDAVDIAIPDPSDVADLDAMFDEWSGDPEEDGATPDAASDPDQVD